HGICCAVGESNANSNRRQSTGTRNNATAAAIAVVESLTHGAIDPMPGTDKAPRCLGSRITHASAVTTNTVATTNSARVIGPSLARSVASTCCASPRSLPGGYITRVSKTQPIGKNTTAIGTPTNIQSTKPMVMPSVSLAVAANTAFGG